MKLPMDHKEIKIKINLYIQKYLIFKQKGQYKEAVEELEKLIVVLNNVIGYAEKNLTEFMNKMLYPDNTKQSDVIKQIEHNQPYKMFSIGQNCFIKLKDGNLSIIKLDQK